MRSRRIRASSPTIPSQPLSRHIHALSPPAIPSRCCHHCSLFIGGVVDTSIKVVVEVLSSFLFCIAKKKVKNNLLTRRWGSGVWLSLLHVDMSQWWCGGAGGAVLSSTVMVVGVSGAVTVIGEGDRGRKKDVKFNFTKSTQSHGVGVSTNLESFLTSKCETSDHPSPLAAPPTPP